MGERRRRRCFAWWADEEIGEMYCVAQRQPHLAARPLRDARRAADSEAAARLFFNPGT